MKEIPLTNYQLLSYFAPGFIVVLCFFICNEPIIDWFTLKLALKDLSLALIASALFCSFIVGLLLDGIRNGILENLFNFLERKKDESEKINWSFFYKGRKEDVALLYARYFIYYCFDFNAIFALFFSCLLLDIYSQLPHKVLISFIFGIAILALWIDGLSLRGDLAEATNYAYPAGDAPVRGTGEQAAA
jgi:hypothetical protein